MNKRGICPIKEKEINNSTRLHVMFLDRSIKLVVKFNNYIVC